MKIAFHLRVPFHQAILEPIYNELKNDFFCIMTENLQKIISFKPKVLVLSDGCDFLEIKRALPETIIVWTTHGFGSKNYSHTCLSGADFACMTSEWVKNSYIKNQFRPRINFWKTGFVLTDEIFRPSSPPSLINRLNQDQPTLLYAPTFCTNLCSCEMLGENWISSLKQIIPSLNIIIKPHPKIKIMNPHWIEWWEQEALKYSDVFVVDDPKENIYRYFHCTDILLSDCSSVFLYFSAMNRPIILINNPNRFEDRKFAPQGFEWQWRDMAQQLDQADLLPSAVQNGLSQPEIHQERRQFYCDKIYGELNDGFAAKRISQKIRTLFFPKEEDREWVEIVWNTRPHFKTLNQLTTQPTTKEKFKKFRRKCYQLLKIRGS